MDNKFKKLIEQDDRLDVQFNEPMSKHTTFGVGGPVPAYVTPQNRDGLQFLLKNAYEYKIPVFCAGSGSNLLVSDEGYSGIVISLKGTFKNLQISDDLSISAESGVMLGTLVKKAINAGAAGFESLNGVPGTVGGALVMNAGAYGSEISNYFQSAMVFDLMGNPKKYEAQEIQFSYRNSTFPSDEIIVEALFKCQPGDLDKIKLKRQAASQKRRDSQPLKFRSAGSIFKNPDANLAAGYLIDKVGLKGTRIGGAEISRKHANFIVNQDSASADDIMGLIRMAQKEVAEKYQINLELEVKLLGFQI